MYIPNPLRCFKCQKYGHSRTHCKRTALCANCGQDDHEYEDCTNDSCCVNCKQQHAAFSKDCPQWKKEKKILETKYTKNISFGEARKLVEEQTSPLQKAISKGNAPSFVEVATSSQQNNTNDKDAQIKSLREENIALRVELATMKKDMLELRLALAKLQSGAQFVQTVPSPVSKSDDEEGVQDEERAPSEASKSRSSLESVQTDEEEKMTSPRGTGPPTQTEKRTPPAKVSNPNSAPKALPHSNKSEREKLDPIHKGGPPARVSTPKNITKPDEPKKKFVRDSTISPATKGAGQRQKRQSQFGSNPDQSNINNHNG